jgi:hypothetical protein
MVADAKRLLCALINIFMHHHARTDQGAHVCVESDDLACLIPGTENLERAREWLARLVEGVQSLCVIILEDFGGVVPDDDACDVLRFLAERCHNAPKTIKILASRSVCFPDILPHVGPLCIPI